MQVQRIQSNGNLKPIFTSSHLPLRKEIAKLTNPTKKSVKDLYGTFGLDLYEGKKNLTILSEKELKKSKSFISKIVNLITERELLDYKEGDTLTDVINKFIENKGNGFVKEIEKMFGKKGLSKLNDSDVYIMTFNFNDTKRFIHLPY